MQTPTPQDQHGFDVGIADGETPFDWACRAAEQERAAIHQRAHQQQGVRTLCTNPCRCNNRR
jgi:hypothetical protein